MGIGGIFQKKSNKHQEEEEGLSPEKLKEIQAQEDKLITLVKKIVKEINSDAKLRKEVIAATNENESDLLTGKPIDKFVLPSPEVFVPSDHEYVSFEFMSNISESLYLALLDIIAPIITERIKADKSIGHSVKSIQFDEECYKNYKFELYVDWN